jgi:hypothetical protein
MLEPGKARRAFRGWCERCGVSISQYRDFCDACESALRLDDSAKLAGLVSAHETLLTARVAASGGPRTFWRMLDHAVKHIDAQVREIVCE